MNASTAVAKTFLPESHEPSWSFSVRSLIILSTAVAGGCTLAVRLPGVGFMAGLLLAMVTVRTLLVIKRRRRFGISTSLADKAWLFLRSLLRAVITIFVLCAGTVGSLVIGFVMLVLAASAGYSDFLMAAFTIMSWLLPLSLIFYLLIGIKRRFYRDVFHRV